MCQGGLCPLQQATSCTDLRRGDHSGTAYTKLEDFQSSLLTRCNERRHTPRRRAGSRWVLLLRASPNLGLPRPSQSSARAGRRGLPCHGLTAGLPAVGSPSAHTCPRFLACVGPGGRSSTVIGSRVRVPSAPKWCRSSVGRADNVGDSMTARLELEKEAAVTRFNRPKCTGMRSGDFGSFGQLPTRRSPGQE